MSTSCTGCGKKEATTMFGYAELCGCCSKQRVENYKSKGIYNPFPGPFRNLKGKIRMNGHYTKYIQSSKRLEQIEILFPAGQKEELIRGAIDDGFSVKDHRYVWKDQEGSFEIYVLEKEIQ